MDYEQFYRYLDTRPTAEIKACLQSVTDVATAHSITLEAPTKPVSNIVEAPPQQHRLEISKQVWFQHAVWGRFGSTAEDNLALPELEQAALSLCTTEKVAEFIVGVNKSIDQKFNAIISKSSASNSDEAVKKAHPSIVSAVNTTPHTPRGAQTPQTSWRGVSSVSPHHSHKTTTPFKQAGTAAGQRTPKRSAPAPVHTEVDSESECYFNASDSGSAVLASPVPSRGPILRSNKHQKVQHVVSSPPTQFWTPDKDALLLSAVAEYKEEGWAVVAEHVGGGATAKRCKQYWNGSLKPLQSGMRDDTDWTDIEVSRLTELVPKHTIEPYYSEHTKCMTQQRIDWQAIGSVLGRVPRKCADKWKIVEKYLTTQRPFSREEDALILRREMEWGDRGVGLWASLEMEMNRSGRDIRKRWKEIYEDGTN